MGNEDLHRRIFPDKLDIPVWGNPLSGEMETASPGMRKPIYAAEPPSWKRLLPGWGRQLICSNHSLRDGSSPYTSRMER